MSTKLKHISLLLVLALAIIPLTSAYQMPKIWLVNLTPTPVIAPAAIIGSSSFAGYSLMNAGNVSYIAANWTVAPVTNHTVLQWIGIQATSGRLVQVGTYSSPSGLKDSYHIFYELWPNEDMMPSFNVSVGDKLEASITKLPTQSWFITYKNGSTIELPNEVQWHIYLKDLTSNHTLSIIVVYNFTKAEPEWTFESYHPNANPTAYPLGNFKEAAFSDINAIINGKSYNLCNQYLEQDHTNTTSSAIQSCTAFTMSNT